MKNLQQKHKEWCEKNFGGREPKTSWRSLELVLPITDLVGRLAHHALKAHQGIRGTRDDHEYKFQFIAAKIADIAYAMEEEGVFFGYPSTKTHLDTQCLLGVVEEVGELVSAHNEGRYEECTDAVADIVLYLLDYCNHVGIDFEDAVRTTAEKVHKRDWVKNPVNGEVGE